MILDYKCSQDGASGKKWSAQAQLLTYEHPYEVKVTARGSCFHIICGCYTYGKFLCIPSHGIATELASLSDTFWNLERLTINHPDFSTVDATSIIHALKVISPYVEM